ncbi:hypothetical protein [Metamycoplasma canadense]|uniref:Lipoprotein n=1 Tax=Metamycoplasma canadense TaxID=29554 RepID=A0A077L5H4_9BACT|nr:hypothetical protein [Metamycoplasma canadense]BAP39515.1 hypothetical protein MCAN360_0315 [Metamycoplasma canadense]
MKKLKNIFFFSSLNLISSIPLIAISCSKNNNNVENLNTNNEEQNFNEEFSKENLGFEWTKEQEENLQYILKKYENQDDNTPIDEAKLYEELSKIHKEESKNQNNSQISEDWEDDNKSEILDKKTLEPLPPLLAPEPKERKKDISVDHKEIKEKTNQNHESGFGNFKVTDIKIEKYNYKENKKSREMRSWAISIQGSTEILNSLKGKYLVFEYEFPEGSEEKKANKKGKNTVHLPWIKFRNENAINKEITIRGTEDLKYNNKYILKAFYFLDASERNKSASEIEKLKNERNFLSKEIEV